MSINTFDTLSEQLKHTPESIEFDDVIILIDKVFVFTPTAFTNGTVKNNANENNGHVSFSHLGNTLC